MLVLVLVLVLVLTVPTSPLCNVINDLSPPSSQEPQATVHDGNPELGLGLLLVLCRRRRTIVIHLVPARHIPFPFGRTAQHPTPIFVASRDPHLAHLGITHFTHLARGGRRPRSWRSPNTIRNQSPRICHRIWFGTRTRIRIWAWTQRQPTQRGDYD